MSARTAVVMEDQGIIEVDIVRTGLDVSQPAFVWCTTRMVEGGATPGDDYIPVSKKISFSPGQARAVCYTRDETHQPMGTVASNNNSKLQ